MYAKMSVFYSFFPAAIAKKSCKTNNAWRVSGEGNSSIWSCQERTVIEELSDVQRIKASQGSTTRTEHVPEMCHHPKCNILSWIILSLFYVIDGRAPKLTKILIWEDALCIGNYSMKGFICMPVDNPDQNLIFWPFPMSKGSWSQKRMSPTGGYQNFHTAVQQVGI